MGTSGRRVVVHLNARQCLGLELVRLAVAGLARLTCAEWRPEVSFEQQVEMMVKADTKHIADNR